LGGSDGCQGGGSDEVIAFLSDVHGCCNFLMMTVDALFRDISVYPHDTKKTANVMPHLNVAPMAEHCQNMHWFNTGEEHWTTQLGGGYVENVPDMSPKCHRIMTMSPNCGDKAHGMRHLPSQSLFIGLSYVS